MNNKGMKKTYRRRYTAEWSL